MILDSLKVSLLICVSAPLSRRHIISIFKSAALYKGKIMAQEILMLVGQARLEPSSSLAEADAVAKQGY